MSVPNVSTSSVKKSVQIVSAVIITGMVLFLIWFFYSYGAELWGIFTGGHAAEDLSAFMSQFGVFGALLLVLFQTLQIAIAILPGEPVELAAGMLYGGFFGGILCLIGVLLGSVIVYYVVRRLGKGVISAFHDESKLSKLRMFQRAKNAELLTFILFLVPAIPKDFLTFAAPLTPMKPHRFFLISTLARAPGMFITTYAGVSLLYGNWVLAVCLYGILGIGALIGIFYYRKISAQDETID